MKKCLLFFFILFTLNQSYSQEVLIDSLFRVQPVTTEVYAEKDSTQLIVDLYQPETASKEAKPLIVFMHGGGFAGGSPRNPAEVRFAKIAAAKGYVVGLISYRLVRKGKSFSCDFDADGKMEVFKLAAEDFLDAVSFLKKNAEKYQIDPENIIVGGSSAGAEAVLDAVYNRDLVLEQKNAYPDIQFKAVISLAGAIVDVRYLTEKNAIPGIFFHGTDDNLVPYATAPHHYCDPESPGYLILDGSKTIVEKLKEFNSSYLFYTFEGAKHEISGMPFDDLPAIFQFIKSVVFHKEKVQTTVYH